MKKIILLGPYPPLFSYGGPTRSIKNLSDLLSVSNNCIVISPTRNINGDKIDIKSYENEKVVFSNYPFLEILRNSKNLDIIWFNSFFNIKLFFLVLFCFFKRIKLIVSTRGQLSSKAINTSRPLLKYFFINSVKIFQKFFVFHVTDINEKEDVLKHFSKSKGINVIPNLASLKFKANYQKEVRFVFYSRIHKKKGLLIMLNYIKQNNLKQIKLDIYGFIEDLNYWNQCLDLMKDLENIRYCGQIENGELVNLSNKYSFFILPTLNENFGHVIIELLSLGIIPIISKNTTPFEEIIQSKVGLNFDLYSSHEFNESIQRALKFSNEEVDDLKKKVKEIFTEFTGLQENNKKEYVKFIKSL